MNATTLFKKMAVLVVTSLLAGSASGSIIFSELMYDPNNNDSSWQWIEIYNNGTAAEYLTGWVLDNDEGGSDLTSANISGGSVGAGEYAVLYNGTGISASDFEDAWGTGSNLIAVDNWQPLESSGDTGGIGIWSSLDDYNSDVSKWGLLWWLFGGNTKARLSYNNNLLGAWPTHEMGSSVYLLDVDATLWMSGGNWDLSSAGNMGAWVSTAGDIGSPGRGVPDPGTLTLGAIVLGMTLTALRRRRSRA